MSNLLKRYALMFVVAILLATQIVGILIVQPANAAGYGDRELIYKAKMFGLYQGTKRCIEMRFGGWSGNESLTGTIFTEDVAVGYAAASDGRLSCSNVLGGDNLKAMGYESLDDFVAAAGWTKVQVGYEFTGSGTPEQAAHKALREYFTPPPSTSDKAMIYALYSRAIAAKCNAKLGFGTPPAAESSRTIITDGVIAETGGTQVISGKFVNTGVDPPAAQDGYYVLPKDGGGKEVDNVYELDGGPAQKRTCSFMINVLKANASEFEKEAVNIPESERNAFAPSADEGESAATPTCKIEGIGWMVCPVMDFLSNIAQDSFKLLTDWFLIIDTSYTDNNSGTHAAWEIIKNLANVLFVVFFLIIIYSQLTGFGISNYGIKKVLPRVIIAAILVNMSFLVCQIAVDLSNVLGVSINSFMIGMASAVPTSATAGSVDSFDLASTVKFALVGGVAIYALMSIAGIVVLGAVVSFLLLILLLIVRKILIILLIVIAPLAIVCMLLPNTEGLFKKWRTIFVRLLLVFPLVSLFFGGGYLVRAIMLSATAPPPPSVESIRSDADSNTNGGN